MTRVRRSAAALGLPTLLLAACASTGPLSKTPPRTETTGLADATLATVPASPAPTADWWNAYGDDQLNALARRALASNPNIAGVEARVRKAQALAESAGASLRPYLSASGELPYELTSKNSLIPPPFSGHWDWQPSLSLALNYDFDFWGRNRAALNAALSSAQASALEAEDIRLQLVAGLVTAYVQFDRAWGQKEFADRLVAGRQRQLTLTRQRFDAGLDTAVESRQAAAALAQAQAEAIAWQEQITLTGNQVATLAGAGPDLTRLLRRPTLHDAPQFGLPSNVPADLLGHRPDVAAARLRIEASLSNVETARAQFYPDLNLSLFAGLSSFGLDRFARASSLQAGVKPAFSLPILDSQRLRANLHGSEADRDAAIAAYNGALLDALQQVADPLVQLQSVEAQRPRLDEAVKASDEALKLAQLRFEKGLGNYLTVIVAETQWIAASRSRLDLDAKARSANAALAKAVGGGWSPASSKS